MDGQEVANNVTSLVINSEFILLTTLRHMLLCVQLNHKGLQSLIKGQCGPGRRIERGSRLVTSVAGDTNVILQMPRGNLECIQPRPLTLHVATIYLDSGQYGEAFQLLRKQRINLNLLCDYRPTDFLANIDCVVDELKDPTWLCLFLSELQEDNVTCTMYKEYYAHLESLPGTLKNKVCVYFIGVHTSEHCKKYTVLMQSLKGAAEFLGQCFHLLPPIHQTSSPLRTSSVELPNWQHKDTTVFWLTVDGNMYLNRK